MPRDGSGNYTYPPGTPGIPDTTIESAKYNGYIADVQQDLNLPRPIVAGGTGANNATAARANLQAESAMATVTNYDTQVWENGSFWSGSGAIGGPVSGHTFGGTCLIINNDPTYIILEARDITDITTPGRSYIREKKAGVWGAWAFNDAGQFVELSGDTMTGDLLISKTTPTLTLNKTSGGQNSLVIGTSVNVMRWAIALGNSTAEGPTAVGSDFSIHSYDNAGTAIDVPLSIERASGRITIKEPTASAHAATKNYVDSTTVSLSGDTMTGNLGVNGSLSVGTGMAVVGPVGFTGSTGSMSVASPGYQFVINSAGTAGDGAFMAFNRTGIFVSTLGINTDNVLRYGGGSSGAVSWRVVHEGLSNVLLPSNLFVGGGDIRVRAAAGANATFQLDDEAGTAKGYTRWDRTSGNVQLANGGSSLQIAADGRINLGSGFVSRSGYGGAYGANNHNFSWNGTLHAWVDSSDLGIVTVTSDYRIKKDVTDLPGTWDTVKALRPIKYTQAQYTPQIEVQSRLERAAAEREQAAKDGREVKPAPELQPMFPADNIERWGFIAHELQATMIPSAATGVKDDPINVQSPNPWTVLAALTKALQEAMARIEALEAAQAAP